MKIKAVRVRNFRSVRDETLDCEDLTALVGVNGCGKSTFLRALDLFYSPSSRLTPEDFYNREVEREIALAVTYVNLSSAAQEKFASYIQGDSLTVERVFAYDGIKASSKLYGSRLQNPEFESIRVAASATEKKELYIALSRNPRYSTLAKWKNAIQSGEVLSQWEKENPESLVWARDEGKFFGFAEVGQGYLGEFTRFLFIPAIRDAATDSSEAKGSVITDLMDLVVRSVIAEKTNVRCLREETQSRYAEVMNPEKLPELQALQASLSETLKVFAPSAKARLIGSLLRRFIFRCPKQTCVWSKTDTLVPWFEPAMGCSGHLS